MNGTSAPPTGSTRPAVPPIGSAKTMSYKSGHIRKIRWNDILNSMFDGMYILDTKRRIQLWNKAAERITGYSSEEVMGRYCSDNILNHTDDHGCSLCSSSCPAQACMEDRGLHEDEVFLRHKRGHRVPVLVRCAPLYDGNGVLAGAVETFGPSVISNRRTAEVEALRRDALSDSLTGLPNRRYIDRMLELSVEEMRRYDRPFGVLIIDADDFKQVNDEHGHGVGDEVLKMIAKTMQHACRSSDMIARFGGEEFMCIARELHDKNMLREVGERLRGLVGASVRSSHSYVVEVTVSVGASMALKDDDPQSIYRRADKALYEAKRAGKNRVVIL